jgi:hypothetical protein
MTSSSHLIRHQLSQGLYARVAAKLKLGPNGRSTVRRVAREERSSARIQKALAEEQLRIEREVQKLAKAQQKRKSVRRVAA